MSEQWKVALASVPKPEEEAAFNKKLSIIKILLQLPLVNDLAPMTVEVDEAISTLQDNILSSVDTGYLQDVKVFGFSFEDIDGRDMGDTSPDLLTSKSLTSNRAVDTTTAMIRFQDITKPLSASDISNIQAATQNFHKFGSTPSATLVLEAWRFAKRTGLDPTSSPAWEQWFFQRPETAEKKKMLNAEDKKRMEGMTNAFGEAGPKPLELFDSMVAKSREQRLEWDKRNKA